MKSLLVIIVFSLQCSLIMARAQFIVLTNNGTVAITGYNGPGGAVMIPSTINGLPVASIASNAFQFATSCTSVSIPSSVTDIGANAFYGCTGLHSVSIGNDVVLIEDGAFAGCTNLLGAYFMGDAPAAATNAFASDLEATAFYFQGSDGWGAVYAGLPTAVFPFAYSSNLDGTLEITDYFGTNSQMAIPGSIYDIAVTTIGPYAFESSGVSDLILPDSIQTIGYSAFYNCSMLTNATLSRNLTTIADWAFILCPLQSVNIPAGVVSIGSQVFGDCNDLTAINVDPANTAYMSQNGVLFSHDATVLIQYPLGKAGNAYTIPGTVTMIGDYAFADCMLSSIKMPDSVGSIGQFVFVNDGWLTNLNLSLGLTNIGDFAFFEVGWTNVAIPAGVTAIGESAFQCQWLAAINVDPGNLYYIKEFISMWTFIRRHSGSWVIGRRNAPSWATL